MKTRRIVFKVILLLCILQPSIINGQKITTISGRIDKIKQPKEDMGKRVEWIIKAGGGLNFNSVLFDSAYGSYNFSFGMRYKLNSYGFYTGGKIGSSMTVIEYYYYDGYYDEYYHDHYDYCNKVGFGIGPEFGLCHTVAKNLQIDASLGTNYMYFTGGSNNHMFNPEANIGLWYKNVLFSLQYSPTIAPDDGYTYFVHRIFLNFGFRF